MRLIKNSIYSTLGETYSEIRTVYALHPAPRCSASLDSASHQGGSLEMENKYKYDAQRTIPEYSFNRLSGGRRDRASLPMPKNIIPLSKKEEASILETASRIFHIKISHRSPPILIPTLRPFSAQLTISPRIKHRTRICIYSTRVYLLSVSGERQRDRVLGFLERRFVLKGLT